jgi:hypothetical protein
VLLVVQVPEGLRVVHAEGPTAAVIQGPHVQFDPLPEMPGRTEALFKLQVRGVAAGAWQVRVRVEADPSAPPVQQEYRLRVLGAFRDGFRPVSGTANIGAPR